MQSLSANEKYEFNKLQKRLRSGVGKAIADFNMIEEGDRVMVCLSGGKDSFTMLQVLMSLQKSAPIHFDLVAVNMDQKQPGFPEEVLPTYLSNLKVPYKIIEKNTYKVVMDKTPEGKTTCSLCSRLRRGTLYEAAKDLGCNKLALGHHRNDIIETFFLNFFFAGKMETMPPKFKNDAGDLVVLRPLAFCKESDIETYAAYQEFPIIPCNLCGSQENLARKKVGRLIDSLAEDNPKVPSNILHALKSVKPSQLMDEKLWDFKHLEQQRDIALADALQADE